ncbi:MAG: ribosomal protein Ctc-form [Acidimicrobiales bacterium]|nr:ribosomal protein Ctc-form [Acidimicrobiales bacterium]
MEEVTITADVGRPIGSRPARRLRAEGKVPAVLYGHGVDAQALAVDARELRNALTGEAGLNALITLRIDSESHLAMARHLQRHPVKGSVDHVDFVIVRRDEIVTAEVPITLVGEATDLHQHDGIIEQQLFNLTIKAKPMDIPSGIEADISGLVIGEAVRVADLKLPSGVETEVDPEESVVVGQPPTAEELPTPAEGEEAAEGAEAAAEGAPAAEGEGASSAEGGGGGSREGSSDSEG